MSRPGLALTIAAVGAAGLIAGGALALLAFKPREAAARLQIQAQAADEDRSSASIAGRNAVVDRFPTAVADFGPVFVHGDQDDAVVCGTVDLNEPDDAFDGPERFIYVQGVLLIEEVDGSGVLADRWRAFCGQASAERRQKETVTTSWEPAPSLVVT